MIWIIITAVLTITLAHGHYRLGPERSGQINAGLTAAFCGFGLWGVISEGSGVIWFLTFLTGIAWWMVRRVSNGPAVR